MGKNDVIASLTHAELVKMPDIELLGRLQLLRTAVVRVPAWLSQYQGLLKWRGHPKKPQLLHFAEVLSCVDEQLVARLHYLADTQKADRLAQLDYLAVLRLRDTEADFSRRWPALSFSKEVDIKP